MIMVLQSNTSFGATQTPGEHFGVSCDECKAAICGIRHKCNFCPNYDLCSQCRQRGVHSHHMMHELQPYPHQSNFPQPPTPYPQYPHPTSPPNQYSNPPYPQYPQSPGQYPQAPGQYPIPPQTFNPNASHPYPAYPQAQYPSQGGQTPLPSNNPMPTMQYPFSPSPYPCQNPSSTFTSHTYPQYPSQYPHDHTSSPIDASHSSQQPPSCIDSVTAAQQQTQIQNSTPIQATVSTQSTSSAQTTTQTQGSTTQAPPVVQGQTTTDPGSVDCRSPFPVHVIRDFPPPGRNRRRHPPSTQTHQPILGQLPSSVLDHRGVQNLMRRMVLTGSTTGTNIVNQTHPAASNQPTSASGGSDNLTTFRWSPAQQGIPSRRFPLQSSDEEHVKVIERMKASGGDSHVAKVILISRIENYTLFNIYKSCKEEMERENGAGFQNERKLWHGTSADVLDNIYRGGFNRSYCGKNATAYGKGVYFATGFSYSAGNTYSPPDAKGQKYVFLCRVLTGHFAKGQTGLNEPPMRTTELRYDSVVDNVINPNMFVIFKDMQVYPEYVITLKA